MAGNAVLPDPIARMIADPQAYAEWNELHRVLSRVRRDYPFARAELPEFNPFWVASRYEDIQTVARQGALFLSGLSSLQTNEALRFARESGAGRVFRSVVAMNEPDHAKFRQLTQAWFQPRSLRQIDERLRALARGFVDKLRDAGGECDFVGEIAVHYPLMVIMSILGVPDEDEPFMLRLTQEFFGSADAEMNRAKVALSPIEAEASKAKVAADARGYFRALSEARRREPRDDLSSLIANAEIDGAPISDLDAMGYYITIAFAGHDTTASSLAGAIWALSENPRQLTELRRDLTLVPRLVEEALRWTSPIHQFVRIAARDCEVAGQAVSKGDWVVLCFPSGNRDESVFDDPFTFRADRHPNRQIAFGYGPHMCLGMHLARMEMSIFFQELLPRLESLELAGTPRRTVTNFVGGPKYVPIRYRMTR
jgi:cytochrome P450